MVLRPQVFHVGTEGFVAEAGDVLYVQTALYTAEPPNVGTPLVPSAPNIFQLPAFTAKQGPQTPPPASDQSAFDR